MENDQFCSFFLMSIYALAFSLIFILRKSAFPKILSSSDSRYTDVSYMSEMQSQHTSYSTITSTNY